MEIRSREDFKKLKMNPFFKGIVVTDSMEPLIMVGDKIIVEVGNQELKRFDIVVFFQNGKLICHYLWAKNVIIQPILFQTRSLKYVKKDFPVAMEDYLGKVVSHRLPKLEKLKIIFSQIF